ncbi:hypothetical protein LCGC14_0423110 [marine sediment metagenome]|uniref:Uncharacterized protein n=1 Tax=marine sediment metagenome TaxID=412755 RepID=A0A0F9VZR3_9ZZZZ
MILHTRTQLMNWLEENAPTASIRRAVGQGSVEFLGWFSTLPGSNFSGWVIIVRSTITTLVWHVVVRLSPLTNVSYCVWVLDEDPPWQHYNSGNSANPFMQGDNPEQYRQNRENFKAQGCTTLHQEDISS